MSPSVPPSLPSPREPRGRLGICVRSESGAVLPGCQVAAASERATTDAGGRVEFELPAERVFVAVTPPRGVELHETRGQMTVQRDQLTELTIVLAPRRTVSFCCRIVAAADARPLGEATLYPHFAESSTSDGQGLAMLEIDALARFVDVWLEGFALRRVRVEPGHETPATAMVVPMSAEAVLCLAVVDPAGAALGGGNATVFYAPRHIVWPLGSAAGGDHETGFGDVDPFGKVEIGRLPAGVPMQLEVWISDDYGRIDEQPLLLQPGRNERRVVMQPCGGIRGHVRDANGQPVAGVVVRSMAAEAEGTMRVTGGYQYPPGIVGDSEATAADGAFCIRQLAPGPYLVGTVGDEERVAVVQRVVVPTGRDVDLDLRLVPGLAIAGRVLGPEGKPAAGIPVYARVDGENAAWDRTDQEGRFRLYPLPAGECELVVVGDSGLGFVEPARALSGDQRVELHLRVVSRGLAGRVVPGGDAWVAARCRVSGATAMTSCDLDGSFAFAQLELGTWDLHAEDGLGHVAVGSVEIRDAQDPPPVTMVLTSRALILLSHPQADEFVVVRGVEVAAFETLAGGGAYEARVPPGNWTVVFRRGGVELQRRDVVVGAGERVRVEGGG
ncbi:MAG: carboxypeptidase-like regulatory domain-containing protein [Planctomycetes bacterium]|nr:carboxypeptidase-like regulatory domain-containing protein [Planctomycetota bacterium]